MTSTGYSCHILLKLEFSGEIFKKCKKCSITIFGKNSSKSSLGVQPLLKIKTSQFNQHSIRISTDPKSNSSVQNSVTAPFLSKMNPCHILLHISFGSIPVLSYSHKMSYVTCPTKVFWPEFWMGTSTPIYMYLKWRPFRPFWFWFRDCTH
jgi:hypothetical protein